MQKNRVLIVDDDSRVCGLLKKVAESQGFEALAIDNPDLVEPSYQGFEPNLVMLDLQMGHKDGIQLLRYLANQKTEADIFLISGLHRDVILTAQKFAQILHLRIDKIYNKPIDIDSIASDLRSKYQDPYQPHQKESKASHQELAAAINQGNICVNYQPIIELVSEKVIAVELLARWRDEIDHLVFPDNFISIAERFGLIEKLTYLVLEIGLSEYTQHLQKNKNISMYLNLSSNLFYDLGIPDHLESLLKQYEFDPHRLILEVNNHVMFKDFTTTMDILARLRIKGFRLCIDNFDRRSLELIQNYHLPFTELKLNRMYVTRLKNDCERIPQIVSAIEFGKRLGLKISAKGVDSQQVLDQVKRLGCDTAQGFHISYPLTVSGLKAWCEYRNTANLQSESSRLR